jgi:hypothetical protein
MSDAPSGPNWWQASDGKWYPPTAEQGPPAPPPSHPPGWWLASDGKWYPPTAEQGPTPPPTPPPGPVAVPHGAKGTTLPRPALVVIALLALVVVVGVIGSAVDNQGSEGARESAETKKPLTGAAWLAAHPDYVDDLEEGWEEIAPLQTVAELECDLFERGKFNCIVLCVDLLNWQRGMSSTYPQGPSPLLEEVLQQVKDGASECYVGSDAKALPTLLQAKEGIAQLLVEAEGQ